MQSDKIPTFITDIKINEIYICSDSEKQKMKYFCCQLFSIFSSTIFPCNTFRFLPQLVCLFSICSWPH